MDNMYQGYRPDRTPTAPFEPYSTEPRRRHRGRVVAGIALASVLAGGGVFAAVTMAGSAPAATGSTGPTGQAAVLNSALTMAASPSAATGGVTSGPRRWLRNPLVRLRLLGGMDGQFTFETKTGPRTLAFQRGTIQSVAGGDVVVRATDGLKWTWEIVSDSVVRESGKKTTASALASGQLVFVGGPVIDGARDARLIVIRAAAKPGSTSGASTS
jgi:hypothetical protein